MSTPMMRSTPPPAAATPLVAAVVIGRNEEAYIGRCLASVVEAVSGYAGAEVVFVDSRSTDRTRDIARTHPVRVIEISDAVPLSPALGRVVGERLTQSEFVLFVDGDTEIDGHWLRAALEHMQAHPEVGGVCGKLREVYYTDGQVVGGHPDCFDAAPTPEAVEDPGGNAVYRRASLDAAGSFNPFLTSYEEAELTARLGHAGYAVVRLPLVLGTHHTGLRGSLKELGRRWRDNLIRGYGQALRISVGTPFLRTHVRRQKRYLQFLAVATAGGLALLTSALLGRWWLLAAWIGLGAALILAFMVRSRSLTKPFLLIADWSVWSVPLVLGFLETPRDPRSLSIERAVRPPETSRG